LLWLVAGLGNPGRKYENTRHNLGFRVVDQIAERLGVEFSQKKDYLISEGLYGDQRMVLIKPLTFMNLSGMAVRTVLRYRAISPDNLIVVHDDLDLPVGRIRIRRRGSSGGHKGVQSIIDQSGTSEFIRVKIGIDGPRDRPAEIYVLEKFHPNEREIINEAVSRASDAVFRIVMDGVSHAMTEYNR
jgi:PTH1 family peptidyl-tRNA hydrolase